VPAADVVEFRSGARAVGKVLAIRKEKKEFDFEIQLRGRTFKRTYPFRSVLAVTMDGKRYVLEGHPESDSAGANDDKDAASSARRSRSEIITLINQAGHTPPEWFASTPLEYPKTLDLTWPLKPPKGGWNNQKNVGQYIWDIINPNPNRWRSGVKFVHHMMARDKSDRSKLKRDMNSLGHMYFNFFQDYARAAFWLQQAGVRKGMSDGVFLAECYWRLGSRAMAMEMLAAKSLPLQAIKLLGDMGETSKAIQLADAFARAGRPGQAYSLAGDACRRAGQYDRAIQYYRRVLSGASFRNKEYEKRYRERARESIQAIQLFDQADVKKVADGTYTASAAAYNGHLDVEVRVAAGRIESVKVTSHHEKQFYSALTDTPNRIIRKQSVRGIDAVSHATITSQSIVIATAKALAKGTHK